MKHSSRSLIHDYSLWLWPISTMAHSDLGHNHDPYRPWPIMTMTMTMTHLDYSPLWPWLWLWSMLTMTMTMTHHHHNHNYHGLATLLLLLLILLFDLCFPHVRGFCLWRSSCEKRSESSLCEKMSPVRWAMLLLPPVLPRRISTGSFLVRIDLRLVREGER